MTEHTIEGTWEEIARQAEKWPGQRFRLTVLTREDPRAQSGGAPAYLKRTSEEFQRSLDALGRGNELLPVLPPEAFERESLYADDEAAC